ncbi:MAG TPA: T9SS type A sorting domain-containing protein, partial [Saprospiraceae bacterium]|nr:T9SS type A sorting domain-containing protein [Saprospiraceae bacterium]
FNFSTKLEIKNDLNCTHLVIYNMIGEVVKTIDIHSPEIELYRDDLPQGLYMICLMENQAIRHTAKVVVSD